MKKVDHENFVIVNLIRDAVEDKGCRLSTVDLNNLIVKIDGPDDRIGDCARAVADIV